MSLPIVFKHLIYVTSFFSLLPQTINAQNKPVQKLIWSDEFDKSGLPDSSRWSYDVGGHGWGNNELQYYTRDSLGNARVQKGHLIIELKKQAIAGNKYSSARLVTKGKQSWMYGTFEIRAKLPKGLGTWPAIWMLSSTTPLKWPDDGEIDIMEHVGYDPGVVHATIHTKAYNHVKGTQKSGIIQVPDFSEKFHVYTLVWSKDSMSMYIDKRPYFTYKNEHSGYTTWPFDQPSHLLLNLAFGGNWGGAKGIDEAVLPAQMVVDYVRVYQ